MCKCVGQALVINDAYAKSLIDKARVARLATVNSQNKPNLVPVVFVFDGAHYYLPLDEQGANIHRLIFCCLHPFVLLDLVSDSIPVSITFSKAT